MGGTFNPPHIAHLICAQEARVQLDLDRVLLIPDRIPPHKELDDDPGPEHRLELCRRAAVGDPGLEVLDIETRREGTSYTVDTLTELLRRNPDNELHLIVGGDVAAGFPQWREPERVLSMAVLAVARRRGTSRSRVEEALAGLRGGERTVFFKMPRVAISSTMIRRRIRAGEPIRYLVPEQVSDYIDQEGLYR